MESAHILEVRVSQYLSIITITSISIGASRLNMRQYEAYI